MAKIQLVEVCEQGGRARRPPPGTPVILAIDLSRTKFVWSVWWDGAVRDRLSTPAGLEHVQAIVNRYRQCPLHVVYEACGFGYAVAWWLEAEGIRVTVVAPSRLERAPGRGVKTDRIDADTLARKAAHGELRGIYLPPRVLHERRQLGRTYAQAVKERKRAQVRIRSLLQEQGRLGPLPSAGWPAYATWLAGQRLPEPVATCVSALQNLRASAEREARRLHAALLLLAAHPDYVALATALAAQPGVGRSSAIRLILELGDMGRFPTPGSLPRYLGLTPSEYSTGETVRRGHILKCGPGALRALLLQCAWAAVRKGHDPALRAVFDRLAPRVGRKRAMIAVARRLVVALRERWLEVERPTGEVAIA